MNYNNLPEEMRAMPNWSCYKTYTNKEGKRKKVIISPKDGKFAKSNMPETWADFETAKHINSMGVKVLLAPDFHPKAIELMKDNQSLKLVKLHTPLKDIRKMCMEEIKITQKVNSKISGLCPVYFRFRGKDGRLFSMESFVFK